MSPAGDLRMAVRAPVDLHATEIATTKTNTSLVARTTQQ